MRASYVPSLSIFVANFADGFAAPASFTAARRSSSEFRRTAVSHDPFLGGAEFAPFNIARCSSSRCCSTLLRYSGFPVQLTLRRADNDASFVARSRLDAAEKLDLRGLGADTDSGAACGAANTPGFIASPLSALSSSCLPRAALAICKLRSLVAFRKPTAKKKLQKLSRLR
jgi:hypothetical protein